MFDSNNSSRAEGFNTPDTIFFTSLFMLFRSALYSLTLARSTTLESDWKLLASRSIFRIYKFIITNTSESQNTEEIKEALPTEKIKSEEDTIASASSIPSFISETFCFFSSAN